MTSNSTLKGVTLFWAPCGPLLRFTSERRLVDGRDVLYTANNRSESYTKGTFHISDLNPQVEMRWAMSRWEIFRLGLRCIYAAIRRPDRGFG